MAGQSVTEGRTASGLLLRASTLTYLGLMVLLPLLALGVESSSLGLRAFLKALTDPFAWHALKLTFATALAMVAINAVAGTATAWVLVRYPFPGKPLVNALIDLPIAVPTVVTGLMLVALYGPTSVLGAFLTAHGWGIIYEKPGIVLALLFVTYPFVVRSDSPTEYGIHLMACYFIVHHHGGRIEAGSEEGKGTCFTLRLPLNPDQAPVPQSEQEFLHKVLLSETIWEKLISSD